MYPTWERAGDGTQLWEKQSAPVHLFLLFCVCLGSYAVPCLLMHNPRYVLLRQSLKSCLRIINYLEPEAQVLMNFNKLITTTVGQWWRKRSLLGLLQSFLGKEEKWIRIKVVVFISSSGTDNTVYFLCYYLFIYLCIVNHDDVQAHLEGVMKEMKPASVCGTWKADFKRWRLTGNAFVTGTALLPLNRIAQKPWEEAADAIVGWTCWQSCRVVGCMKSPWTCDFGNMYVF